MLRSNSCEWSIDGQDWRAGYLLTLKDTSKELKVSALPRASPEALAIFFFRSSIFEIDMII